MSSKKTTVREDGPVYRSVMVGGGMSAPPIGIPKPRTFSKSSTTDSHAKTVRIAEGSHAPLTWKISSSLPILPTHYPLERCHVYIRDASAQTIATRVAESLRKQSIHATFNESKASADTLHHGRFTVSLFRDGDAIIVEVQRRSGCGFEFHRAAKCILNAASATACPKTPKFSVPSSVKQAYNKDQMNQEALEIAIGMLKQDRMDAQLMGLESLAQLSRSNPEFVAQRCLLQRNNACVVQNSILCLVMRKTLPLQESEDADADLDEIVQEHVNQMHRCALTILANGLGALDRPVESWTAFDDMMEELVQQLGHASETPFEACQAAKCLKACYARAKENSQLSEAMHVAMQEGTYRHDELQQCTASLYAAQQDSKSI